MNIFDYVKTDLFFKPLALKNKRIYYDCIHILIDKTKELPVLYESDARDCIMMYLRNAQIHIDDKRVERIIQEQQNMSDEIFDAEDDESTDLMPGKIIALFRKCGWILPREIGRNGEYVVNISLECRRVMDFLRKMTEKAEEGMMSNYIFAMYDLMRTALEEDYGRKERPYINILVPMVEYETELKNELLDLKDRISVIMKAVIELQDMNSIGRFFLKDEILEQFFNEYFFVKNNGLIPIQIGYIRDGVRQLVQEDMQDRIIRECVERQRLDYEAARERVEKYLTELMYFLEVEYEENMELIDNRINNYYNLANTRIMLMANNGERLEGVINDFLSTIDALPQDEHDNAMDKLSGCVQIMSHQYISHKSYEKKKRVDNEERANSVEVNELTEEEMEQLTKELQENAVNRYSVKKVGSYFNTVIGNNKKMDIEEMKVRTKDEALMVAAAIVYSGNEEFPYDVVLSDEEVDTEVARFLNATFIRKK